MASKEVREQLRIARTQLWTIPNILSYFRILLIPVFVALYVKGFGLYAFGALVLSAATDFLDGYIARRFNMITTLGKAVDPIADKLTQAAMILCVGLNYPVMWILLGVHAAKELIMLFCSFYVFMKLGTVIGARGYGKVCTGLLYAVMMLHIILPEVPENVTLALMIICSGMIIFCLISYVLLYRSEIRKHKAQTE